jgi:hypothetical protein
MLGQCTFLSNVKFSVLFAEPANVNPQSKKPLKDRATQIHTFLQSFIA